MIEHGVDELYQCAADMGGAEYIFSGGNDARIMRHSALINLHAADVASRRRVGKVFFSSSACIYPRYNQQNPSSPRCEESSAYPADPDSEYGWEKLFAERLWSAYRRNHDLDVRIARFHNVYGSGNAWRGGREKAPAALCRKVSEAEDGGVIDVWGDGQQTRSFLYIDDCLDGVRALMESDCAGPVNIGSEEMISINDLARMVIRLSGKQLAIRNVPGPVGVRGRNSDNTLMHRSTGWRPRVSLEEGMSRTYRFVAAEVEARRRRAGAASSVGA